MNVVPLQKTEELTTAPELLATTLSVGALPAIVDETEEDNILTDTLLDGGDGRSLF